MAIRKALSVEDTNLNSTTLSTRGNREYKDIDLTFLTNSGPGGVSKSGDVFRKNGVAAVQQAVKTLLLSSSFDKPFEPDFGVGLEDLLFELNTTVDRNEIAALIEEKLTIFEPRARLEDLQMFAEANGNRLRVEVYFSVVNTEETFTVTTTVNRVR